MDVEQIRPPVVIRLLRPPKSGLQVVRIGHHLAFDAEGLRRLGEIDVRAAVIAGHVLAGLELLTGDERPTAIALVVVALVVDDDVGDRRLIARLAPQRLRTAEQATAVADAGEYWTIGLRQL